MFSLNNVGKFTSTPRPDKRSQPIDRYAICPFDAENAGKKCQHFLQYVFSTGMELGYSTAPSVISPKKKSLQTTYLPEKIAGLRRSRQSGMLYAGQLRQVGGRDSSQLGREAQTGE